MTKHTPATPRMAAATAARNIEAANDRIVRLLSDRAKLVDLAEAVVTAYGKTLLPTHTEKHLLDGAAALLRELGEE
jgi:hypothetical protein